MLISLEFMLLRQQTKLLILGLQDLDYGSRIGSSSPMYDVARTCKTAMKILRHRSRQRFFFSKGKGSSLGPLLSASLANGGRPARNQVQPAS